MSPFRDSLSSQTYWCTADSAAADVQLRWCLHWQPYHFGCGMAALFSAGSITVELRYTREPQIFAGVVSRVDPLTAPVAYTWRTHELHAS